MVKIIFLGLINFIEVIYFIRQDSGGDSLFLDTVVFEVVVDDRCFVFLNSPAIDANILPLKAF